MKPWTYVLALPIAAFVVGLAFELGRIVAERATRPSIQQLGHERCLLNAYSEPDRSGGRYGFSRGIDWCDWAKPD